jgi:excisionase family DNA binding protein
MAFTPTEPIFSVAEAADKLDITPGRVRQLVVEGRIVPTRFGHALVIPQSQVDQYERTRRPYRKPGGQSGTSCSTD